MLALHNWLELVPGGSIHAAFVLPQLDTLEGFLTKHCVQSMHYTPFQTNASPGIARSSAV